MASEESRDASSAAPARAPAYKALKGETARFKTTVVERDKIPAMDREEIDQSLLGDPFSS